MKRTLQTGKNTRTTGSVGSMQASSLPAHKKPIQNEQAYQGNDDRNADHDFFRLPFSLLIHDGVDSEDSLTRYSVMVCVRMPVGS